MSINHLKSSPELAGITSEDLQAVQMRSARVANSVYKVAVAKYYGYPEAVPTPIAAPTVVATSPEVAEQSLNPQITHLSLAEQAVLKAYESEF